MAMARKPPARKPGGAAGGGGGGARPKARSRRSPWMPVLAVLGAVAVIVVAFLAIRWATSPPSRPAPASTVSAQQLTAQLTGISQAQLDQVGIGTATPGIKKISDSPLKGPGGKPEVLYIGGEFCPYCAAERWSMIIALSRFGTISGLQTATSSSSDVFPSTPTFTFRSASYTSQSIDFVPVEEFGSSSNTIRQPLTSSQQALAQRYGSGGIPFIDFGNRSALSGATYSPGLLQGMSWEQVVQSLSNPSSDQARAILGSANLLTAAICQATGQQPGSVCGSSGVKAAAAHLA